MLQIVFSDLDGTLLDHRTYDYSPALPALAKLQEKQIPLVFCTSKTAAEMIPFRKEIKNKDPFIVENGGGRFFHLSSNSEKGEAVAQLIGLYQANRGGPVRSMGLGDSRNDLSMLEEVDIPVIIPNPHSIAPLADEFSGGHRAHTPGPKGWNDAVLFFTGN